MNHCPSCDYPLPHDRERLGARCPNCRDPLYEPASRLSRPVREGEGACALHAGREAVGTCGRCGNYFCAVCHTRWRDQVLCTACVERAVASREATPEQARAHLRQALLGLLMSLGAWVVFTLGILLVLVISSSPNLYVLIFVVLLMFICAMLLAVMGTGNAVAALRTRGQQMIMATSALLIGGLFLGVFLGYYILELWVM
jgi:hypothetical protein